MAQPMQPSTNQNDDEDLDEALRAATERAVAEWYRLDPLANPANITSLLPSPEALAEMEADRAEEEQLLAMARELGEPFETSTTVTEILAEDRR